MGGWSLEWSECDPYQCWEELRDNWEATEFRSWLRYRQGIPMLDACTEGGIASAVDPEVDTRFGFEGELCRRSEHNVGLNQSYTWEPRGMHLGYRNCRTWLLDLIGGLQLQSEVEGTSLLREQSMHKPNITSRGFGIQPGVEKRHFSKLH